MIFGLCRGLGGPSREGGENGRTAVVWGLVVSALLLAGGANAAHAKSSVAACAAAELGLHALHIALYLPMESEVVSRIQDVAEFVNDNAENLKKGYDAVTAAKKKGDLEKKLRAFNVAPFPGSDCFSDSVDSERKWIVAIDTKLPDTSKFWPTLADGMDSGALCRGYEKLEHGIDTIDSWEKEIDDKIERLDAAERRIRRMSRAASRMGYLLQDQTAFFLDHGGGIGGIFANTTAIGLTSLSTFFDTDFKLDANDVASKAKHKRIAAQRAKKKLETERGKLKDAAEELKLKDGAKPCDEMMDEMVASKQKSDRPQLLDQIVSEKEDADRQAIMNQMVAEKENADRAPAGGHKHDNGAGQFLSNFLRGFATGLGAMGGVPAVTGGGGGNARCGQVRAQIQADRNWLAQVGPAAAAANRAAVNSVRQAHDANVAWFNQNCR